MPIIINDLGMRLTQVHECSGLAVFECETEKQYLHTNTCMATGTVYNLQPGWLGVDIEYLLY